MAVNLFRCTVRVGFFLIKNHFKVRIYGKGNFKLVSPTMKSHKIILFKNVYPDCFIVYTIFIVSVPGCFAVESLEAVQEEVLSVFITTIVSPK